MRAGTPLLIVLALGLASVWAPIALAHENECPMVLETLAHCVAHHLEAGEIFNEGVYLSLLAKADAALAAFNRGQTETATNILVAFINEVNALRSVQISASAADHMIAHAQAAIDALL